MFYFVKGDWGKYLNEVVECPSLRDGSPPLGDRSKLIDGKDGDEYSRAAAELGGERGYYGFFPQMDRDKTSADKIF